MLRFTGLHVHLTLVDSHSGLVHIQGNYLVMLLNFPAANLCTWHHNVDGSQAWAGDRDHVSSQSLLSTQLRHMLHHATVNLIYMAITGGPQERVGDRDHVSSQPLLSSHPRHVLPHAAA